MNYQKTIIAGRLAHTPELKSLPSGGSVATFSLAVNRVWVKDGEKHEETDWHNCVAFGKTADNLAKYAEGGQVLLIDGRNVTRSWEDKDTGKKMYRTEIQVGTFQFGAKSQARAERKAGEANKTATPQQDAPTMPDYPEEDINPEDIPF